MKKNIPNIITLTRLLLLIPIIFALFKHNYQLAFYTVVLAGLSDGLDGYLARRYQWTSQFGAIADPFADKLLMLATYLSLAWSALIPAWLFIAIVGRDLLIVMGVLFYRHFIEEPAFAASWLSKINTFLQIILLLVLLFEHGFMLPLGHLTIILMYLVFVTTIVSFAHYCWVWGRRAYYVLSRDPKHPTHQVS